MITVSDPICETCDKPFKLKTVVINCRECVLLGEKIIDKNSMVHGLEEALNIINITKVAIVEGMQIIEKMNGTEKKFYEGGANSTLAVVEKLIKIAIEKRLNDAV